MRDTSDRTDLRETIRTVVKRADLLDCLAQGPTRKRDLRDDLCVSRSTVYKAVRELEERDLVVEDGDAVRLTLFGRLFVERYQSFVETAADVDRQRTLLSALPPDAPVTTDLLVGAEVVLAERHAPSRPLDAVEDGVLAADRVASIAPVAFRRFVDLYYEQLVAGDLQAEIVLGADVVEYLRSDYAERFREAVTADCCTVWRTDETLPFGLVLGEGDEDEVAVIVYSEEGTPVGTIRNDSPAALAWGRDVFETYRENAERLDAG